MYIRAHAYFPICYSSHEIGQLVEVRRILSPTHLLSLLLLNCDQIQMSIDIFTPFVLGTRAIQLSNEDEKRTDLWPLQLSTRCSPYKTIHAKTTIPKIIQFKLSGRHRFSFQL